MDIETLITEIFVRKSIWTNQKYDNTKTVEIMWNEISKILGYPKDACKKKWDYLKDRYRYELDKRSNPNYKEEKYPWEYYHQMIFMKNQLEESNFDRTTEEDNDDEIEYIKITSDYSDGSDGSSVKRIKKFEEHETVEPNSLDEIGYSETNNILETLEDDDDDNNDVVIDETTIIEENDNEDQESEDLMFFNSLLGFMNDMTPIQKLKVRNKIQNIIIDELNNIDE